MRSQRTIQLIVVAALSSMIGALTVACATGSDEDPPPPPSVLETDACPNFADLGTWLENHPPGALPDEQVDRVVWCAGLEQAESYKQLETDQTGPILEALKLPSRHSLSGCPAIGRRPIILIAETQTAAYRAFIPDQGCDYHPDVEQAITSTPWRESAKQPR